MSLTMHLTDECYHRALAEEHLLGWNAASEAAEKVAVFSRDIHRRAYEQRKDTRDRVAAESLNIVVESIRKLRKP